MREHRRDHTTHASTGSFLPRSERREVSIFLAGRKADDLGLPKKTRGKDIPDIMYITVDFDRSESSPLTSLAYSSTRTVEGYKEESLWHSRKPPVALLGPRILTKENLS
jgi:hypothetical protein